MSRLLFAGAAGEVTGSRHHLSLPMGKLLLDCGMFQGRREESKAKTAKFLFPAAEVDAVILSHAHIDHCGALPLLVKQGFKGRIFCSDASAQLARLLLKDSAHIQEQDAYFWNKRHPGQAIKALYDHKDVEATIKLIEAVPMGLAFEALPGLKAHLHEAGHILGSAQVSLRWMENGREKDLYFTGDLGQPDSPLLKDPFRPKHAPQTLLLESTYGNREHAGDGPTSESLRDAIAPVLARGGRVLIPSFAVGRTQELLYELAGLVEAGEVPPLPIYIDSPLASAATELFRQHRELMDADFHEGWRGRDPFSLPYLRFTESKEESQAIQRQKGPCIILSASGMCESGRIVHHLAHELPDPKNKLLFVGYQAAHTLGRRLRDGAKVAKVFGDEVPVEAEVQALDGFSAHAGRKELLEWVAALPEKPGAIHLVHGEMTASSALGLALREAGHKVDVATMGREVEL